MQRDRKPKKHRAPAAAEYEVITEAPSPSLATREDANRLFETVRANIVVVDQPLVLVSQIQRSGGTLLNKLFDGHPGVHSHPSELHIGHPVKSKWPILDLAGTSDAWLGQLKEAWIAKRFELGFGKRVLNRAGYPSLPFTLAPSFLAHLFRIVCAEDPPRSPREILDRYFTAFFNAWIDCQGLRESPKRWITAFCPRLAWGDGRNGFWADYPDGRLIMCHRDPRGWYASAVLHKASYRDVASALALWRRNANEILAAKAERPGNVFVLTYEGLVADPERTMGTIAGWLGIRPDPILLSPTFNRLPTLPNSSYLLRDWGISTESLERWREVLSGGTVAQVEAETLELDAAVRETADVT